LIYLELIIKFKELQKKNIKLEIKIIKKIIEKINIIIVTEKINIFNKIGLIFKFLIILENEFVVQ
jgi:hypothetical protein